MNAPEDRFEVGRLSGLISPLRRGLLRAARTAEHLPDIPDAQIEVLRALPTGTVRSGEMSPLSRPTSNRSSGPFTVAPAG